MSAVVTGVGIPMLRNRDLSFILDPVPQACFLFPVPCSLPLHVLHCLGQVAQA